MTPTHSRLPVRHRIAAARVLAVLACGGISSGAGAQAPCTPVEQWRFNGHACAAVVLGQFTDDDGDGRVTAADDPDVAFWRRDDSEPGTEWTNFVIADAATGAVHVNQRLFNRGFAGVAAGDVDGDGEGDLFYTSGIRLARITSGRVAWNVGNPPGVVSLPRVIGLADLDQDGDVEIHLGHVVWDADGSHLWTGSRSSGVSFSSAADIDGSSPGLELIVGRVLYSSDGRVLWEAETAPEGPTAVGDLDGDLEPEIVLLAHEPLGNASLTVLDRHGAVMGAPIPMGTRAEYAPLLADLDGDGLPEVVIVRLVLPPAPTVVAFKWSPTGLVPFWEAPLGRGPIVPTAFDFDGDGRMEVVLADEIGLVVLDGLTGAEIARFPNPSVTQGELAVVADVDGDGITDLVAPACGNTTSPPNPALVVLQCASPCVARAAWNQSTYRVGNVNDDGTIPRFEPPPWLSHNSWGAQIGTGPCDVHCGATVAPRLPDRSVCAGDVVRLDASGHGFAACDGVITHEWTDDAGTPVGTGPTLDVSPTGTTRYRVDVRCSTRPRCRLADAATVTVSRRTTLGPASAVDLLPCNRGIEITWPPADFTTAGGGTYNVYRSDLAGGGTCADALSRAPLVTGLTNTRWIDADTLPGVAHAWVVEAQDIATAGACLPVGPGGHAVAHACTPPVEDVSESDPPEVVGAVLRAAHVGDRVEMLWPGARPLLPGEHFHLLKAWSQPTSTFSRVNPEGDLSSSFEEIDTTAALQFFDLRVANACEAESVD